MAPAITVPRLLERAGLTLADIDLLEIHEAFAAQVLANVAAWECGWKGRPTGSGGLEQSERERQLGGGGAPLGGDGRADPHDAGQRDGAAQCAPRIDQHLRRRRDGGSVPAHEGMSRRKRPLA